MRVLAIDPSLRGTGFAVLEKNGANVRAIEWGTIKNKADLLASSCLPDRQLATRVSKPMGRELAQYTST